jgi:hydroxylamine reductase (hybrid-cluster protein)
MIDKQYNITDYLKKFYKLHENFSVKDIEDILIFSVFWNHIENGSNKSQYNVIFDFIESKDIEEDNKILAEIHCYFLNRYKNNSYNFDTLKKIENITKKEEERHKKIKYFLSNDMENDFNNKKEFVAYIIYRFRNRLFHWEKNIIDDQNKNFIVINNFLHYLLTK